MGITEFKRSRMLRSYSLPHHQHQQISTASDLIIHLLVLITTFVYHKEGHKETAKNNLNITIQRESRPMGKLNTNQTPTIFIQSWKMQINKELMTNP